ncbi:anti-sigma factor [Cellulomonas cellasea]|uniref:anti-sigma factor n=1 Tax=Cellulomonas cellasea TaxID=43670 RepID=UPI0025A34004|nr:anti-sigma factor [Cellulomonas cellasea]MDM8083763.1 anti-sigma factor [Cellulomonas cellasea]
MSPNDAHVDDDVLSLLALGEKVGSVEERQHLASCPECSDELAHLRAIVGVARAADGDEPLVAPAPHVWERVAAELGLDPAPVRAAEDGPTRAAEEAAREEGRASVVPLRRPRRTWAWVAGAAAAGVVIGGAGAWWATREPAPTIVASATLEALPGWDAQGVAELETTADGSRVLVVDMSGVMPDEDGLREVWLLRPDVSGLVSLGLLAGDSGRFVLPDDLDVGEFPVVDVSSEPLDGDPAHSGDSIVRGTLGA